VLFTPAAQGYELPQEEVWQQQPGEPYFFLSSDKL
jgi:hypothetical protein